MELKLTLEQYEALKVLSQCAENFVDHIEKVFKRTGLDNVDGCRLDMCFDPKYETIGRKVEFGLYSEAEKCGYFEILREVNSDEWKLDSSSTEEFKILFGDEDFRKRIREIADTEHPLPADGLWISTHDDPPYVDGGD